MVYLIARYSKQFGFNILSLINIVWSLLISNEFGFNILCGTTSNERYGLFIRKKSDRLFINNIQPIR